MNRRWQVAVAVAAGAIVLLGIWLGLRTWMRPADALMTTPAGQMMKSDDGMKQTDDGMMKTDGMTRPGGGM